MTPIEEGIVLFTGQYSLKNTGSLFRLVPRALVEEHLKTESNRTKGFLMRLKIAGYIEMSASAIRLTHKCLDLFAGVECLQWTEEEPPVGITFFANVDGQRQVCTYRDGFYGVVTGADVMWLDKETKVRWIKETIS